NTTEAMKNFRMVMAHDEEQFLPALELCWRVLPDAGRLLDEAIPARADSYLDFLRFLMERDQPQGTDVVWDRLLGLKQSFAIERVFPYFNYLSKRGEGGRLLHAWRDLAEVEPTLRDYQPGENRIVNGGFELPVLGGGLDWRYQNLPDVMVTIDSTDFHDGQKSLSIAFDHAAVSDVGIVQYIPAEPNTRYEFVAYARVEDLESESGPRFKVADVHSGTTLLVTEDLLGTSPWKEFRQSFTTGPETRLLGLRVVRSRGTSIIRGKLLIDDIRIAR
ncbi:MAG: carbohydrate binding domain-containing protein, partial [Terriglobales bacterium]